MSKQKRRVFGGASLAVVTALILGKILFFPPETEAAIVQGIDPEQLMLSAKNLPEFDDTYQRHLGVLDTLRVTP